MGRPSQQLFEDIIKRGKLVNNKVTVQDYCNALTIHGKDLGVLKGKTTRKKAENIPIQIYSTNHNQRTLY
jgi:hypothetical protein